MTLPHKTRSKAAVSLLLVVLAMSTPAEARRRFRIGSFGGGSSESITLVHDLPDRQPFVKEGNFFDVGWLNSDARAGYVIYHGDRFTQIDEAEIGALTSILGFDPTAKHKAEHAEEFAAAAAKAEAERAHKEARIASGQMIEPQPGESSESYDKRKQAFIAQHRGSGTGNENPATRSESEGASTGSEPSSPFGMGSIFGSLLVMVLFWLGKRALVNRGKASNAERIEKAGAEFETAADLDTESFDAKVARRLAQLEAGPAPAELAAAAPAPQLRGFGRKAA